MLNLLETFCAVAETGSLSKAAERLHITQPAVTRQIKALEQELGAVLLTRTTHGVALTPMGDRLLPHARQALAAVAACRRVATDAGPGPGRLSVAAGNMIMQFVLPPVLAQVKAARPGLQLELHAGHYQECLDLLITYRVDLALIATPQIPPGLKARPLFTDPMMLVAAPCSRLAEQPESSLAELAGVTVLVLPRDSGLRQRVIRVLWEAGIDHKLEEYPTVETLKTMVALDLGVTLLPRSAVADEVAQGRLAAIPLRDWPDQGQAVLAVTRSEGELPEPARALLRLLRQRQESD